MTTTGRFNWYELMTTDTKAAAEFYGKVVGWTMEAMGDGAYTVFNTAEGGIGGMLKAPDDKAGPGAVWLGYVAVDNVDDYARRFEAAGGSIHRAPADIPGIGRFSVVADPQGAALALFTPLSRADGAAPPALDKPGYPSWRELVTTDGPSAFEFYSTMFGWEKSAGHDMGLMGVYQLFAYDGADRGGIMTRPAHVPHSFLGYYFRVDAVGAATERLRAGGGTVVNGPIQVPSGDWVVQARDPQGAGFALQSPKAYGADYSAA